MANNYYDIAYNDYQFLLANVNRGFYNQTLPQIQQIIEKLLKSIIVDFDIGDDSINILKSHRLDRLYDVVIKSLQIKSTVSVKDLAWVTNFYFDCRYPGDNFIIATQEQEEDALKILEDVFNVVNNIRAKGISNNPL